MKPFPELKFHKGSKSYYIYRNGHREYLGRDYADAQRRYESLRKANEFTGSPAVRHEPTAGLSISVAELCLQYIEFRRSDGADSRAMGRIFAATRFVREQFGTLPVDEFRGRALKAVRQTMLDARGITRSKPSPKRRHFAPQNVEATGYSRTYINMLTGVIKAIWRWGVSEELVRPDTLAALQSVTILRKGKGGRETLRVVPVEPWVVEATIPAMSPVIASMVRLHQLAGMRPGELVALRRQDISTSPTEKVPLPQTRLQLAAFEVDGVLVWLAIPESHKTLHKGKPRVIVLGPKAQALLRPYLDRKPDEFLFAPREAVAGTRGERSPRTQTDRYTTQSYGRAVGYAIEKANRQRIEETPPLPLLPHWRPNQLRHLVGSEVAEEFDRWTASAVLGNGADVIDVYVEQELRKAAKAAAVLG